MDASPPLSIPRLRLPRHSPHLAEEALTPVAGPSHNPNLLHADDDEDEDAESTPRMSSSAIDRHSPRVAAIPGLPTDNPTARLRALLSRVPNSPPNGNMPHASGSRPLIIPSGSEPESDFEPPHSIASASSFARESLKELFSHALRDPGNTPRKHGRPRRNSIDASEVEASPRVEVERASYKAKRRSLSDEEADKSSEYSHSLDWDTSSIFSPLVGNLNTSGRSLHISATSKFDALRQRLNRSSSVMPSLPQEQGTHTIFVAALTSYLIAFQRWSWICPCLHQTPVQIPPWSHHFRWIYLLILRHARQALPCAPSRCQSIWICSPVRSK